jgi:hypothetical protein
VTMNLMQRYAQTKFRPPVRSLAQVDLVKLVCLFDKGVEAVVAFLDLGEEVADSFPLYREPYPSSEFELGVALGTGGAGRWASKMASRSPALEVLFLSMSRWPASVVMYPATSRMVWS